MRLATFDQVLAQLDSLPDRPEVGPALAHCAQSIEYSLAGFPQQRAWLVRAAPREPPGSGRRSVPHFAYGPVSKADYAAVQSMHIADHLSSFST